MLIFDPQPVRALDLEQLVSETLGVRVVTTHTAAEFLAAAAAPGIELALVDESLTATPPSALKIIWLCDAAPAEPGPLRRLRRPIGSADIASLADVPDRGP